MRVCPKTKPCFINNEYGLVFVPIANYWAHCYVLCHFERLLGENPPEICDEIVELIEADMNIQSIDSLNENITQDEILGAISKLKCSKSAGSDNLTSEMFIACSTSIVPLLSVLFNFMFENEMFPDSWTEGIVVPIPKPGDATDPNNYRPILQDLYVNTH